MIHPAGTDRGVAVRCRSPQGAFEASRAITAFIALNFKVQQFDPDWQRQLAKPIGDHNLVRLGRNVDLPSSWNPLLNFVPILLQLYPDPVRHILGGGIRIRFYRLEINPALGM